jgi:hypothetical protein
VLSIKCYYINEVKEDDMEGRVARMMRMRNTYVYIILVRKPEAKVPFGRPWRRLEDNIKINIKLIGCEGVYWIKWLRIGCSGWLL